MSIYTITDTARASGTVTVEAYDVADAIGPWYAGMLDKGDPTPLGEAILKLEAALVCGDDTEAHGWATYLGVSVVEW